MKISELITELEKVKQFAGDNEIKFNHPDCDGLWDVKKLTLMGTIEHLNCVVELEDEDIEEP